MLQKPNDAATVAAVAKKPAGPGASEGASDRKGPLPFAQRPGVRRAVGRNIRNSPEFQAATTPEERQAARKLVRPTVKAQVYKRAAQKVIARRSKVRFSPRTSS